MRNLNFAQNYNGKLLLDIFTTIRLSETPNLIVGDELNICLKSKIIGVATVLSLKEIAFGKISENLAWIDSGQPLHYCLKMFANFYSGKMLTTDRPMIVYTLRFTKKDPKIFEELFKEYWATFTDKYAYRDLFNYPAN